jgi:membrane protease YdiL (CAAX protease family)
MGNLLSVPVSHALLKISVLVLAIIVAVGSGITKADVGLLSRHDARWRDLGMGAMTAGAVTTIVIVVGALPRNPYIAEFGLLGFLLQIILLSSIAEEILCRGLLQTELEKAFAGRESYLGLSYPVWFSGMFFGIMHLSLLSVAPLSTVVVTVAFTAVLGTLCALARERTGGLVAPIVVHMLGNVGGIAGGIMLAIVGRLSSGSAS